MIETEIHHKDTCLVISIKKKIDYRQKMHNRNYICQQCGKIYRLKDQGLYACSVRKCCGDLLRSLSHEQAFAATHMKVSARPEWFAKGGHIIKGPSERKRWLPAFKATDIETAKSQKTNHRPKKPENYLGKVIDVYLKIAEPFVTNNMQVLDHLTSLAAPEHIANVLFITVPEFRKRIYRYVGDYNLNNQPKKYLNEFLDFLFYLSCHDDRGSIVRELSAISRAKGIDIPDLKMVPIGYSQKINKLVKNLDKNNIVICKTLPKKTAKPMSSVLKIR